jgi:hypothetical protein
VSFFFVYHFRLLQEFIAGLFVVDFIIALVDDSNYEIHKNHKQQELTKHENGESEVHYLQRMVICLLHRWWCGLLI